MIIIMKKLINSCRVIIDTNIKLQFNMTLERTAWPLYRSHCGLLFVERTLDHCAASSVRLKASYNDGRDAINGGRTRPYLHHKIMKWITKLKH